MWTKRYTILGPKRGQNGVKIGQNRSKWAKMGQTAQNEPKMVKIIHFTLQVYAVDRRPLRTPTESLQSDCKHPNGPIWTNSSSGSISGSRGCRGARVSGSGWLGWSRLEPAKWPKIEKKDGKCQILGCLQIAQNAELWHV